MNAYCEMCLFCRGPITLKLPMAYSAFPMAISHIAGTAYYTAVQRQLISKGSALIGPDRQKQPASTKSTNKKKSSPPSPAKTTSMTERKSVPYIHYEHTHPAATKDASLLQEILDEEFRSVKQKALNALPRLVWLCGSAAQSTREAYWMRSFGSRARRMLRQRPPWYARARRVVRSLVRSAGLGAAAVHGSIVQMRRSRRSLQVLSAAAQP